MLNQLMYSSTASSASVRVRQGPWSSASSVLNRPMVDSARALMPLCQARGFDVDEGLEDEGVDLAGDVALEASQDFSLRLSPKLVRRAA